MTKPGAKAEEPPASKQAAAKPPETGKQGVSAAAKALTPAKPIDITTKSKPGSRPTPAEIAGGARGGSSKQEATTPRFAFADEVEPKSKGAAKSPSGAPTEPQTGKPAAKKIDTVVSVTKSQAGHSKAEKDAPADKPKPKK